MTKPQCWSVLGQAIDPRLVRAVSTALPAALLSISAAWPSQSAFAQAETNVVCPQFGVPIGNAPCVWYGCIDTLQGTYLSGGTVAPSEPSCTTSDGRVGEIQCWFTPDPDPTVLGTAEWTCPPVEPVRETGIVNPKYMIMTVVYAPPGSEGCQFDSTASYGEGNTLGTTISAGHSFAAGTTVRVSGGSEVAGAEIGASFSASQSQADSSEMSVTSRRSTSVSAPGPCHDGIDHGFDRIYLLLSPQIPVEFSDPAGCESCGGEQVSWTVAENAGTEWGVYTWELQHPEEARQATKDLFETHHILPEDQAQMLAANPLANLAGDEIVELDYPRFVRTGRNLPYAPPLDGTPPDSHTHEMGNETMTRSMMALEWSYSVGLQSSVSVGFSPLVASKFSVENSWTWTNSNSAAFAESGSTFASVTLGSPSSAWTGAPAVTVYYDTLFKTYAFVPSF